MSESNQQLVVLPSDQELIEVGRCAMPRQLRPNWYRKIVDVIRSRHYTWLGEGLGGAPVDEAMVTLTTDVMHICKREGIDIDWLIEQSKAKCEQEEMALVNAEATRRTAA